MVEGARGQSGQREPTGDEYRSGGVVQVLAGNLRWLAAAQLASRLAGFAIVILLARELGRMDFGRYSLAIGIGGIIDGLLQLGMGGYIVREGSRSPALLSRFVGHVLILRVGLGALGVLVAVGFGLIVEYDSTTLAVVALLGGAAVLQVLGATYESGLLALERARDAAVVRAGRELAVAATAAVAVLAGAQVIGVSLAIAIAGALGIPWAWRRLHRVSGEHPRLRLAGLRTTLTVSAILVVSQGFHRILTYIDSVMVHAFLGNVQTGLYGAAYRLLLGLMVLPAIYVGATTRMISRLAHTDREAMTMVYSRAVAHLTMAGVAAGCGGAILSDRIIALLYGDVYAEAASALTLLLLSALVMFPVAMTGMTAYALDLQNRIAVIWGIALVGNVTANLFLIPSLGIEGAAVATLAAECFGLAAMISALRRSGLRTDVVETFGKPLLAGAVMSAAVWFLRAFPLPVPIAVGAVVFVGALLALRALTPEDRTLVRAVLGRRGEGIPGRTAER